MKPFRRASADCADVVNAVRPVDVVAAAFLIHFAFGVVVLIGVAPHRVHALVAYMYVCSRELFVLHIYSIQLAVLINQLQRPDLITE